MLNTLLISLITLTLTVNAASPTVDPVAQALELTESTQKLMAQTTSRPKRKTLFEGYLREITKRENAIEKIETDPQRKLQLTLSGIRIYADQIDLDDLSPEGCASSRNSIQVAHSPKDEKPETVPGEATIALKFLDLLCDRKNAQ